MGCNICKNNNDIIVEEEFEYPDRQNSAKDKMIIPSTIENRFERKTIDSSPNLKIKNEALESINNIKKIINNINDDKSIEKNRIKNINEKIETNKIMNNSCSKPNKEIEIENKDESNLFSINKNDYNKRVIELINEIRLNPPKYSYVIFNNLQYISKKIKIEANDETGQNDEKEEIFFLKKVKVKLYKGERAFKEAADYLKIKAPMNELILKDEIKLNLPDNEEEINDNFFIKKQLIQIRKNNNINAFFKDSIKNPEVGVMLMIVGDYKNAENKKRNAILNPEYKYIAVNSKFIGNSFIAYYTFSK